MFTEGQLIFAIFFVITFTIIIIISYKKDLKFLKNTYKGVRWVLIGFIIFFSLLVILKKLVNSGKFNVAFKLNPTNLLQVMSFAEKKKYMPQKSTWFHPKPLDGLILSKVIS